MSATRDTETDWGFLAEPVHDVAEPMAANWRDNAWIAFWDPPAELFGILHVSTSPTGRGCRARCSVRVSGRSAEIIEPLEAGTFSSSSIEFGLDGRVRVAANGLEVELSATPRFVAGDYSKTGVIPGLDDGPSLSHYQQGAEIDLSIALDGEALSTTCLGFRDRTWGPRDESVQFVEWLGIEGCFEEFDLTAIKFRDAAGAITTQGFVLRHDEAVPFREMSTRRSPSGSLAGVDFQAEGCEPMALTLRDAREGFALPFGDGGPPPSTVAYDQSVDFLLGDQTIGSGIAEQGAVHVL